MTMLKGKHFVAEIEGVRCTVVETAVPEARKNFLEDLLRSNGLEVKAEKEKTKDGTQLDTFVTGVTDLTFNPVIALYEKKLVRKDGRTVSPAYWYQWPEELWDLPYWTFQR